MEEVNLEKDVGAISAGESSVDKASEEYLSIGPAPSASLAADENGKIGADHQRGELIEDTEIPCLSNVYASTSSDQKVQISLKPSDQSGSKNDEHDVHVTISEEGHQIPAPQSLDMSKETINNISVLEDKNSITISVAQNDGNNSSSTPHKLGKEPNHCQQEVVNMENKTSVSLDLNDTAQKPKDSTSCKISDDQLNNQHNSSGEVGQKQHSYNLLPEKLDRHKDDVQDAQQNEAQAPNPKQVTSYRHLVDTAAPFESVKEAVTKFGGIVDWKAHKAQMLERHKHLQLELQKVREEIPEIKKQLQATEDTKAQVLKELDNNKRLIEELRLNLERTQTEEAQAKQDLDLVQLRVQEMEQGISDEASVAAKAQVEVAKARHAAAVAELKLTKDELEALRGESASLVKDRDMAVIKAEEAVFASKEIERTVEKLTIELITTKESLEAAHALHLEAEEHRIGAGLAREQDVLTWDKELKQAEEEIKQLNEQILKTRYLKSKLDTASTLLTKFKAELAAYMEAKLNEELEGAKEKPDDEGETKETRTSIQTALASTRKEVEEVNANIEKMKSEVDMLRVAASTLKSELDSEKAALATLRQMEGMASIAVSSLEAEIERTEAEIELVRTKEREMREKMVKLPKLLQQSAQEADQAKTAAQLAREELKNTKEEAEQAKASTSTMEIRLQATLKEIEAAKASEKLALAAIKALQESEQAAAMGSEESSSGVTLPLEEYYKLSKRVHKAEELANQRVTAAISQIQVAKDSESKSLERLDESMKELSKKKESLAVALEKAEKAKAGKLGVEQELRKWREEHEQRRRAINTSQSPANPSRSPPKSFEESGESKSFNREDVSALYVQPTQNSKFYTPGDNAMNVRHMNAVPDVKGRRKKSFFPRFILFLVRRKAQSSK